MPIAHVQTDRNFSPGSSASTMAVTLLGVTAGATLIVNQIQYYPFGIVVNSVADDHSDSFSLSHESTSGSNPSFARQFVAYNVVGGDTTVTITMSGNTYMAMFLSEFTGVAPNGLDQVVSQIEAGVTAPSSGNIPAPTAQADELLVALVGRANTTGTFTAGSGFAPIPTNGKVEGGGGGVDGAMEYRIVTTTGTYAATFTLSTSDGTNTLLATYRAAAAAGLLSLSASESLLVGDTRRQIG